MIARSPIRKRRSKPRRVSVNRDKDYLKFLHEEGRCAVCLTHPVDRMKRVWAQIIDPAHGPVNGMRSKGPDNEAIPLCRVHHDEQTRLTWPNFCIKYGFDRQKEIGVWQALYEIWKVHQSWPSPVQ